MSCFFFFAFCLCSVIMATDGLWGVMDHSQALTIVDDIRDSGLAAIKLTGKRRRVRLERTCMIEG